MILQLLLVIGTTAIVEAVLQQPLANSCLYKLPMPTKPDPEDCVGYFALYNDRYVQQYCPPGAKYSTILGCCITGRCPPCNCQNIVTTTATTTRADSSTPTNECGSTESALTTSDVTYSESGDDSTFEGSSTEFPEQSSMDTTTNEKDTSTETTNRPDETTDLTNEVDVTSEASTRPSETTNRASDGTEITTRPPTSKETSASSSPMPSEITSTETKPTKSTDTTKIVTDETTASTRGEKSSSTTELTRSTAEFTKTESTTIMTTSTTSKTTTVPDEKLCATLPTGTFLPDPDHCSRYYVCSYGQAIMMHCPSPLWFDTKLNVCNYPENVSCSANRD